ncbi:condensation domain-containing protein [Streptomyces olivaceus]|uniref:condensation domain-containing protein n=1 Tax=Streptomyces olivaceus TaxID=47716 RepID=UPI00368BBFE9
MARAPLTQRQYRFWLEYLNTPISQRLFMHLVQLVHLPSGTSYEQVAAAAEHIVSRHDALRTRFAVDENGQYVQLVDGPGPLPVHQAELGEVVEDQNDLTGAAAELVQRPLDLSTEWPLRIIALRVAGRLRQLCLVVHHVAADREAVAHLREEVAAAVIAPRAVSHVPGSFIRQLELESGDRARRRGASALRHWNALLPSMPGVVLPYCRDNDQDLQRLGWIDSSALADALRVLHRRIEAPVPGIVLAAINLALTSWSGLHLWRWETLVNNRPKELDANTVGCFMDFTLVQSRVQAGDTFAEYVAAVTRDMLLGVRHSVCDADQLIDIEASNTIQRGTSLDAPMIYNFKGADGDMRAITVPASWPATTFDSAKVQWAERHDPALLFARVHRISEVATISLAARASLLSAEDHRHLIEAVEKIVWSAAADISIPVDELRAEAAAPHWPRIPDWTQLSEDRWVDLAATEGFLAGRLGGSDVRCALEGDPAVLVARITTDAYEPCLADLGRAARDMLPIPGIQVPDRFNLRRPSGGGATYSRSDVFEYAPAAATTVAQSEAERVLREVLEAESGKGTLDFDRSYIEQGGRAAELIRVHFALEARGWTGAPVKTVLGPSSLRNVAARLRRMDDGGAIR